jgi:xanthine/CO dehydrogenase XdhC/CoxF family maturation factor
MSADYPCDGCDTATRARESPSAAIVARHGPDLDRRIRAFALEHGIDYTSAFERVGASAA